MLARESYTEVYFRDLGRRPNRSEYTLKRIGEEMGGEMFFPNTIHSLGCNFYRR
jgi:hypothetical protein